MIIYTTSRCLRGRYTARERRWQQRDNGINYISITVFVLLTSDCEQSKNNLSVRGTQWCSRMSRQ